MLKIGTESHEKAKKTLRIELGKIKWPQISLEAMKIVKFASKWPWKCSEIVKSAQNRLESLVKG